MKILFGYMMPLWFMLFGAISQGVLEISEPVYYATISYVMGLVSAASVTTKGDF